MVATQPTTPLALKVVHRSDPGLDPEKQVNEDACGDSLVPFGHLMVVCDGMGGHVGGKQASETALATIMQDLAAAKRGDPAQALQAAIEHAGQLVYDLGGEGGEQTRPGSTVVALLSHPGGTEVAHVGDSRGYLIRDAQTYALTKDHSIVQELVDAGMLTPEEAAVHPDANKITRALGMAPSVQVELRPVPLEHRKGDIFLLASDGLCDLVSPRELAPLVLKAKSARGLDFAAEQLIALANARGGHDNITVLLGEVLSAPPIVERPAAHNKPNATIPLLPATEVLQQVQRRAERTTEPGGPPIHLSPKGPSGTVPDAPVIASPKRTVPETPALQSSSVADTLQSAHAPSAPGSAKPLAATVADQTPPTMRASESRVETKPSYVRWIVGGVLFVAFGIMLIIIALVWVWWSWSRSASSDTNVAAERVVLASSSMPVRQVFPIKLTDYNAARVTTTRKLIKQVVS